MTGKKRKDCIRYEALLLEQAERPLTRGEEEFLEQHRTSCPDCSVDHAVLSTIRLDESTPPVWPADDVTRHRQIEAALDAAEEEVPSTNVQNPSRFSAKWVALAAGLAAFGFGLGLFYWSQTREGPTRQARRGRGRSNHIAAHVLLAAGDARVDTRPLHGGSSIGVSQTVLVGRGRVAFRLPDASRVLLDAKTEATLVRVEGESVLLRLHRGGLFAQVTPRSRGHFVVEAGSHKVVVVGTAFAVERNENGLSVSVLKGRVRIEGPKGPPVFLDAGEHAKIDGPGHAPGSTESNLKHWKTIRRLLAALPEPHSEPISHIEVDAPGESVVVLDNLQLGPVPVDALVAAGRRHLKVVRQGKVVISEDLRLAADETVARHWTRLAGVSRDGNEFRSESLHAQRSRSGPVRGDSDAAGSTRKLAAAPREASPVRAPLRSGSGQDQDGVVSRKTDEHRDHAEALDEPGPRKVSAPSHSAIQSPVGSESAPEPARHAVFARAVSPSPPESPSPTELLRRARSLRAARSYREAARLYRKLISQWPSRPEANVALVSLGLLEAGALHQPRAALGHLSRYLRIEPKGALALEALFGKARALRSLGKMREQRRILEYIVAQYPGTTQARAAKRMLEKSKARSRGAGKRERRP